METKSAKTERRYVTLSSRSIEYLERLAESGTHGTSVPDVMKTLIEEGIRLAIREGFLSKRELD